MIQFGYALSSEEHDPQTLIDNAVLAEEAGFSFAFISDHYHPWIDAQGHSSFVWSVIGGISQRTKHLYLGTGVTCPIIRIHPTIIAQAAATAQMLLQGRFMLGVGTGENLNEHILGDYWPPIHLRQEMLIEAMDIIERLWTGGVLDYEGAYYVVDNARIYSLPEDVPPLLMAASGKNSAAIAGEYSDGLITTSPDKELLERYKDNGGNEELTFAQLGLCYDKSEEDAVDTIMHWWPNSILPGQLSTELKQPKYFEDASKLVKKEDIKKQMTYGPDPEKHIKAVQEYIDAGYNHIYFHQIGPKQKEFIEFYAEEVLPHFKE